MYLILDNLRVHHAKLVTRWLENIKTVLRYFIYLPIPQSEIPMNTLMAI
ncbi:hypothetical protein [Xenorhabdus sp. NBAII XenSa04]|nr:hypothetical protein [Xenorhabdus sp. NBAII XenSa04]